MLCGARDFYVAVRVEDECNAATDQAYVRASSRRFLRGCMEKESATLGRLDRLVFSYSASNPFLTCDRRRRGRRVPANPRMKRT
jgi:hypothetical protein